MKYPLAMAFAGGDTGSEGGRAAPVLSDGTGVGGSGGSQSKSGPMPPGISSIVPSASSWPGSTVFHVLYKADVSTS